MTFLQHLSFNLFRKLIYEIFVHTLFDLTHLTPVDSLDLSITSPDFLFSLLGLNLLPDLL